MPVDKPDLIAHRGGRKWAPENTLAAFGKSLAAGVDGIELDIQRCASGELVVIHDSDLARTTNGAGLVKDHAWHEIQKLSAGLWYGEEFAEERVPLLAEVLELVAGRAEINIEIKNSPVDYPGIEKDLLRAIESYPYRQSLLISSFDHQLLWRLHQLAPQLNIALLGAAIFLDLPALCQALGASYFHPPLDCLRPDIMEQAGKAGLSVNVWTLNNIAQWEQALRLGVQGIVTDDPAGLKDFLAQLPASD